LQRTVLFGIVKICDLEKNATIMKTALSSHIRNIRIPLVIFFVLMAGIIGFTIWSHQHLPDRVAVHFDGAGQPDRWSGKWEITGVFLGVFALYGIIFGLFSIFLPKLPPGMWNLPKKAYWLAPERMEKTLEMFCRDFLTIGIMMIAFMGWIQWGVFQANTVREDHSLPIPLWGILIFLVAVAVVVIRMIQRFQQIPKSDSIR